MSRGMPLPDRTECRRDEAGTDSRIVSGIILILEGNNLRFFVLKMAQAMARIWP